MVKDIAILAIIMVFAMSSSQVGPNLISTALAIAFFVKLYQFIRKHWWRPAKPAQAPTEMPAEILTNGGLQNELLKSDLEKTSVLPNETLQKRGKVTAKKTVIDAADVLRVKRRFISFDVETTGLNPVTDRIVEIGAVLFVDGEVKDSFTSLVNPGISISPQATDINNITNEMLADAPTELDVYTKLFDFLGNATEGKVVMCAHNAKFDFNFLSNTLSRLGFDADFEYADTLSMAKTYLPGLQNYKQKTVADYLQITPLVSHRAISDAEVCGYIFSSLLNYVTSAEHITFDNQVFDDQAFAEGLSLWKSGERARLEGNLDEALEFFAKAENSGYDAPALYQSYALAYRKLKDYSNEIKKLDEAIEKFPHKADELQYRKGRAVALLQTQHEREKVLAEKEREKANKVPVQEKTVTEHQSRNVKSMLQLDDDGRIVREFESIAAASKELGISSKCIRDAANGIQKHAGGFAWKYKE